jgi:hypothetical protein
LATEQSTFVLDLYDSKKELSAMIVQLQTSYGERRLWLTRNCQESGAKPGPYSFKGKFDKDLQISLFTPNEANYVIESSDPCRTPFWDKENCSQARIHLGSHLGPLCRLGCSNGPNTYAPTPDIWILINAAPAQVSLVCTRDMEFRIICRGQDLPIDHLPDILWEFDKKNADCCWSPDD